MGVNGRTPRGEKGRPEEIACQYAAISFLYHQPGRRAFWRHVIDHLVAADFEYRYIKAALGDLVAAGAIELNHYQELQLTPSEHYNSDRLFE